MLRFLNFILHKNKSLASNTSKINLTKKEIFLIDNHQYNVIEYYTTK
jgi:hypothetical protein